MSIQIGNASKQGINKQITIRVSARSLGCGAPWTSGYFIARSLEYFVPLLLAPAEG